MHEDRRDSFVRLFSSVRVPGVTRGTGEVAAAFALRRPQRLTAPFRGAKSSQRAATENALSPARRPPPLLPAARKGLRIRFGEQNLHRGRRRKSSYRRRAGRRLCSPPPARAAAENALSPAEIPFLRRRYARWHKMKKGIDII